MHHSDTSARSTTRIHLAANSAGRSAHLGPAGQVCRLIKEAWLGRGPARRPDHGTTLPPGDYLYMRAENNYTTQTSTSKRGENNTATTCGRRRWFTADLTPTHEHRQVFSKGGGGDCC